MQLFDGAVQRIDRLGLFPPSGCAEVDAALTASTF
jgi:hypothetical protein